MIRKLFRLIRDIWIYFKTGHSGYLVYTISILNFVVLQHRLFISYIPFLSNYIGGLGKFFIIFILTYVPLASIIGYLEYRKGTIVRTPKLNPYSQDTIEATIKINQGILDYINGNPEAAIKQIESGLSLWKKWLVKNE